MILESQVDINRPASATPSQMSLSRARDFGMKFMPGVEEMPAMTNVSTTQPPAVPNPAVTRGTSEAHGPPAYWNSPHSDSRTEVYEEEEDEYHPYMLSWWWMLKGIGLMVAGALANIFVIGDIFAKMLHHVPVLYGDPTVRRWPRVTGFTSGCAAAGKYLCLGIYDGLAGWVILPYKCAKKDGALGVLKGILMAFGALIFKMSSGGLGFVTHPLFGIYQEAADLCSRLRITISRKPRLHRKDDSPV